MGTKKLVAVLGILAFVSAAVMVAALLSGGPTAGFTPPPFDPEALLGVPDVPAELGYGQLDAQVFQVSLCGVLKPENSKLDIWLTNPAENSVWLKLRLLDRQGNVLGETGLLRPGEYVRQLTLTATPEPGAQVVMKLMAYEPETYHSAGSATLTASIVP